MKKRGLETGCGPKAICKAGQGGTIDPDLDELRL